MSSWPLVLHGDSLGVLHFLLGTAFHAVSLHLFTLLIVLTYEPIPFVLQESIVWNKYFFELSSSIPRIKGRVKIEHSLVKRKGGSPTMDYPPLNTNKKGKITPISRGKEIAQFVV